MFINVNVWRGALQELRTPVAIRAMLRIYTIAIVPIFLGPYWVHVAADFGFAVAFALLVSTAALGQMCLLRQCLTKTNYSY